MDHYTAEHNAEASKPAVVEEPRLRLALTYRGLLEQLADVAERPESVLQLPTLTHAQMAAIIQHWRHRDVIDALAGSATLRGVLTHFLADTSATAEERSQLVGAAVIATLRDYFAPQLLEDVQTVWDRNREVDAIEAPLSHYPGLTDEQVVAQELGLGRTLS
jgi:uncharacterized protein (DUF433 family)